jgi:pimeloyl-ACP methyl ester carboxylesterase
MLHGWGSQASVYDGLAKPLAAGYRVVRPDLPGFGGSQQPPLNWGVEEFAEWVVAFCTKLKLEPYALLGHSFGGQLAVHLAGKGMLKPDRLILVGASAVRPPKTGRDLAYNSVAKVGKRLVPPGALARKLRAKLYSSAGTEDYLLSGPMQPIYRRIINQDQLKYAERISCPTLLIWGEGDDAAPLARGRLLHEAIVASRIEIIPGAGHYVFLDKPQIVAELVEGAL